MTEPEHFAFFLLPEFSHLAFSCAIEPLRIANLLSGRPLYRWTLLSADGRSETCSNGTVTLVHGGLEPQSHVRRLFVISGLNMRQHASPQALGFLRRERARGVPLGAICSGAYILARAGFLNGVETAIHWEYHDLISEEFPQVRLVPSVFVAHEKIVTASGGTAAADMMLHLIATSHGADFATRIADQMVYNAVREGTAAQRVSLQSRRGIRNAHLMGAIRLMEENIEDPIPTGVIAQEVGISSRQLERLFLKYLDATPKVYFMDLRLNRARNLLVQTEHSVTDIAVACGFRSASHFSRVYRSAYGRSPVAQRNTLA